MSCPPETACVCPPARGSAKVVPSPSPHFSATGRFILAGCASLFIATTATAPLPSPATRANASCPFVCCSGTCAEFPSLRALCALRSQTSSDVALTASWARGWRSASARSRGGASRVPVRPARRALRGDLVAVVHAGNAAARRGRRERVVVRGVVQARVDAALVVVLQVEQRQVPVHALVALVRGESSQLWSFSDDHSALESW